MSDKFEKWLDASRSPARLVKNGEPEDDPATPDGYQAVRRVRSYGFSDALFRRHGGSVHAFPWAYLRDWMMDDKGSRLTFIWPETEVILAGRHLEALEEDLQRRIIAEFRQAKPGSITEIPNGMPIIETMAFQPVGGMPPGQ